jgi:uncharacterized protein (DUF1499 family)
MPAPEPPAESSKEILLASHFGESKLDLKSGSHRLFTRKSVVEERDFMRHPDIVRPAVSRAVRRLGWPARTTQSGTIEAAWTSGVLRFEGDVIIKILIVKGATRVRIESTSRRGGFDLGLNARVVRDFFLEVDMQLPM